MTITLYSDNEVVSYWFFRQCQERRDNLQKGIDGRRDFAVLAVKNSG